MFLYPNNQSNQGNQDDQGNQNGQGNQGNQDEGGNQNGQGGQDNQDNHPNQNHHSKSITCPTKVCEDIALSVPVEVRAYVDIKDITLKCGEHHIHQQHQYEKPAQTHKFEITKKISAQIPIDFIAEIEIKDESVYFDVYECK